MNDWVKLKTNNGDIITIPRVVYNDRYKYMESFTLVEDEKPLPKDNGIKESTNYANKVQQPKKAKRELNNEDSVKNNT